MTSRIHQILRAKRTEWMERKEWQSASFPSIFPKVQILSENYLTFQVVYLSTKNLRINQKVQRLESLIRELQMTHPMYLQEHKFRTLVLQAEHRESNFHKP